MIGIIASLAGEIIEVRLAGSNLMFRVGQSPGFAPIEGIRLSKEGCIKEHPDLKDRLDWREESIKRLKEKLSSFRTEDEAMDYVILELKKLGYEILYKQKPGFRVVKLK